MLAIFFRQGFQCVAIRISGYREPNLILKTLQWRHNERDGVSNPASRLFTQLFVQVQIEENIKALRYWHFWGEFTGDQ